MGDCETLAQIVDLTQASKPTYHKTGNCLYLLVLVVFGVSACGSKSPEMQTTTNPASEQQEKAVGPAVQAAIDKPSPEEAERNRVEVKQLISAMKKSVDNFNQDTTFFTEPKVGLMASNVSLIITRSSSGLLTLVAEFQYGGDGWIFWKNAEFNVDGTTISDEAFSNMKVRQDIRDGSFVNETAYKSIDDSQLALFDRLAEGKKVLVRFEGRDRSDFELSQERKENLHRSLRLYRLLKLGTPIA